MKFLIRHLESLLWLLAVICPLLAAMTAERRALTIIAIIWFAATGIVIPLHFWRAWRRLPEVANKKQYAVLVGFEIICALALIGLVVFGVVYKGSTVVR